MSRFTFYRIHKELSKDDSYDVKTEFLGTIETNMYGAWVGNTQKISISTDGKYIIMEAYAVNSRSLGKFRNKEVLLIWEIGEKTEIRPITDSQGNDIPITIIEPSE